MECMKPSEKKPNPIFRAVIYYDIVIRYDVDNYFVSKGYLATSGRVNCNPSTIRGVLRTPRGCFYGLRAILQ